MKTSVQKVKMKTIEKRDYLFLLRRHLGIYSFFLSDTLIKLKNPSVYVFCNIRTKVYFWYNPIY